MYYIFICWIDIFIFSVHCFLFTGSLQDISLKSLPHRRSFRWSVWQINTDVSPPRWHDTLDEFSISISLCRQENVTKSHLLLTISAASVNKAYQEMRQACFWGEELAAGANPAYRIPPRPHSNTQKRKRRPWISAPWTECSLRKRTALSSLLIERNKFSASQCVELGPIQRSFEWDSSLAIFSLSVWATLLIGLTPHSCPERRQTKR